jgi:hypothetical protein
MIRQDRTSNHVSSVTSAPVSGECQLRVDLQTKEDIFIFPLFLSLNSLSKIRINE